MRNGDRLPLEIMARREDWDLGISLYARQVTVGDGFVVAQPMVFEKHNPNLVSPPFLRLEIEAAQQFMDELWRVGLRPTEGTGSAGSLKATERHLADMRTIAFKKLNISGDRG